MGGAGAIGGSGVDDTAGLQIEQMGEDRAAGGGMEALVDAGIHLCDHVGDGFGAGLEMGDDLVFALLAVGDEAADEALGIGDGLAVGGMIDAIIAQQELFEAGHIVGHVAIGRGDDGGGPAHDMIAGEQRLLLRQGKAQVVAGVAGGGDGGEGPAGAGDALSLLHHMIGGVGGIEAGIGAGAIIGQHKRRAADDEGAGGGFQGGGCGAVIEVGVGDEDVADGFSRQAFDQCVDMCWIGGAGIDDGDRAAGLGWADNEGAGAGEGEGRGIVRQQAADKRRALHEMAPGGGIGVSRQVHGRLVTGRRADGKLASGVGGG